MDKIGIRLKRQIMRARLINTILSFYEPFCLIKLKSECLKHRLSYDNAERFSGVVSSIFGLDCKPVDLMPNSDDLSNEIIDLYNLLEEGMKQKIPLFPSEDSSYAFSRDDVMSFMEYEYHNNSLLRMKFMEFYDFSFWVLRASIRTLAIPDVIPHCIEYQIWNGGRIKQVDSRLFRKTFIRLEVDFWSIVSKRADRNRHIEK